MDHSIEHTSIFNGERVCNRAHRVNWRLWLRNGEQRPDKCSGRACRCNARRSKDLSPENLRQDRRGLSSVIMRAAEVQLTVEHQLPVLLYESYPMKIRIKNCENVDIHSATWVMKKFSLPSFEWRFYTAILFVTLVWRAPVPCRMKVSKHPKTVNKLCFLLHSAEYPLSLRLAFLSYNTTNTNSEITKHSCSMVFDAVAKETEVRERERDFSLWYICNKTLYFPIFQIEQDFYVRCDTDRAREITIRVCSNLINRPWQSLVVARLSTLESALYERDQRPANGSQSILYSISNEGNEGIDHFFSDDNLLSLSADGTSGISTSTRTLHPDDRYKVHIGHSNNYC